MSEQRNQTQALATRADIDALPAHTMDDLVRVGQLLAQSGAFGTNNPGMGLVIAATCRQEGISLLEFQRTYHVVNGRPSMRADAMLAEFRKRGGRYTIEENSVDRAAVAVEFEGQKLGMEYTMADAKRIGDCYDANGRTLKHNWKARPEDMLWARLISRMVRRLCPEINAGLYAPEELPDAPERRDPVRISPEVAAARVARHTGASEPVLQDVQPEDAEIVEDGDPAPESSTDYTVCPEGFGEFSGRHWIDIDDDTLVLAVDSTFEEITPTHRAAIRYEIQRRAEGGAA